MVGARRPPRERRVTTDPSIAGIECGEGAYNHRCGCCALPLCSRHNEVQGGFCSNFATIGDNIPGCVWGDSFVPYTATLASQETDVLFTIYAAEGDDWHLPDDGEPLCSIDAMDTIEATLYEAHESDRQFCDECEKRAVEIVADRDGGDE
jgi:hypothetical protein